MANGLFTQARELWQKFFDIYPKDPGMPKALFGAARSYMWERHYDKAVTWFEKLNGDTSKDVPLRQGDAILVPARGSTASVAGEIRRPASYEFRAGDTVGDLVELSGGLSPQGDPRPARRERELPSSRG